MRISIVGRQVSVTPAIKSHIEAKLKKLERYDSKIDQAHVSVHVDKYRHTVEVTLTGKDIRLIGKGLTNDIYSSVDTCVVRLEKQLERRHDRVKEHSLRSSRKVPRVSEPNETAAPAAKIVRTSGLFVRPLSVEEARLELELIRGSPFLTFRNQETGKVNVIYRMKDGHYGLIEET